MLSLYQKNDFSIEKDFWVVSGGLSKFDAARLLFLEFPQFMNFEAFAFFDPDVALDFDALNLLFVEGIKEGKGLFQAAVAPGSHTHWHFLYKKKNGWREVSFVEVMAPFFSRNALASVIGGFSDSISTWGLEYYWYSKCKKLSMAVYDPVVMRHDTPVDTVDGPFYRYLASMGIDPFHELQTVRSASVGKYYIECGVPAWVPLWIKKYYVDLNGIRFALRRRLAMSRLWAVMQPILRVARGKASTKND